MLVGLFVCPPIFLLIWQESTADDDDEESDKSKSEIHDDDEESGQVFLLIPSVYDMSFVIMKDLSSNCLPFLCPCQLFIQ